MTLADPFTSSNARVLNPHAAKPSPAAETKRLQSIYGPKGDLRWREYSGTPGEWQAGYHSQYGFHIKGRHDSDPTPAVDTAIAEHARPHGISYPTPQFPDPATSWAKRKAEAQRQQGTEALSADAYKNPSVPQCLSASVPSPGGLF